MSSRRRSAARRLRLEPWTSAEIHKVTKALQAHDTYGTEYVESEADTARLTDKIKRRVAAGELVPIQSLISRCTGLDSVVLMTDYGADPLDAADWLRQVADQIEGAAPVIRKIVTARLKRSAEQPPV